MVLIALGGVILGLLLMTGVYMLPVERMRSHVAESHETFNYEGIYPQVIQEMKSSQLDNYTDALMYATAIHPGSGNALKDALYNVRYEYYDDSMTQSLNDYANDVVSKESLRYELGYARYWHGYLVVLKPLLLFLNVSEIRLLNLFLQTFLLTLLLHLLAKGYGTRYAVPVIAAVLFLNPLALPLSLQFSWVYYIGLMGGIVVLVINDKFENNCQILFMALGMMTSYFDLLTYPLFTLGLPLGMYLIRRKDAEPMKRIALTFRFCFSWLAGYAVMWSGKWFLASLLGDMDMCEEIKFKIIERTSMVNRSQQSITFQTVLAKVLSVVSNKVYLVSFALLFAVYAVLTVRQKRDCGARRKKSFQEIILWNIPYILIVCMPLVWFAAMANHTNEHYWFTYRELSVAVLAVGIMMADILPDSGKGNIYLSYCRDINTGICCKKQL